MTFTFIILIVSVVGWIVIVNIPLSGKTTYTDDSLLSPVPVSDSSVKEDFAFYGMLKTDEVLVPDSNYTSTPKTAALDYPTLLQISALRDATQANRMSQSLKKAGLVNVRVVTRETDKGIWHLVRTDTYDTYDRLKGAMSIAQRMNFHPRQIQVK